MTELNKTIKRKITKVHSLRRPLLIQIEPPDLLRIKEKGMREWVELSIESLYVKAIKSQCPLMKKGEA